MTAIRRYFPRQYLVPVTLLLVTSFCTLFSLLYYLTAVQDQSKAERDRQHVASAIENTIELAAHDLQDYAVWDEAVRHLVLDFDKEWADDNVSAYLGKVQGYTHVFILDGQETIYSFDRGQQSDPPLDALAQIGPEFLQGLQVAHRLEEGDPAAGGFTMRGNTLYVYAAASVAPLTGKVDMPLGRDVSIVIALEVDEAFLTDIQRRHQTPRLQLIQNPIDDGHVATAELRARGGAVLARVGWAPDLPGTRLMQALLPGFLIIGFISVVAAGVILSRARRASEALEKSRLEARNLAYQDALTGLSNRREMHEVLRYALDQKLDVELLFMDLDGFKETNDVYGHASGDELLREAARRIETAGGVSGLVARTGGDEFAVILFSPEAQDHSRIAELILEKFQQPFQVGGYQVRIGVSIGHVSGDDSVSDEELMRRADVAMYAAKASGKNAWRSYSADLDEANYVRRKIEGPLRVAIEQNKIEVAFQPIVEAGSSQIVGVEALARWTDPALGRVTPDRFIPVAEQTGLITELGRNMLLNACRAALPWDIHLSVNLSPAQFWDGDLVRMVMGSLEQAEFPPQRLELEITEHYLLRRPEDAEKILKILRAEGIRISLDDFGSGYASIGYLQRLSLDRIKIDRSFVERSAQSRRAARLVEAVAGLGLALGLEVTAEGVETEQQALMMKQIGCTHLQGWLYGRPVPAEELVCRLSQLAA